MDMSFARRNDSWTRQNRPSVAFESLLSSIAARQAVSPTAKIHTLIENNAFRSNLFCSGISVFSPLRQTQRQRVSASFNAATAAMLRTCQ
jgi:hypothetical protein